MESWTGDPGSVVNSAQCSLLLKFGFALHPDKLNLLGFQQIGVDREEMAIVDFLEYLILGF